MSENKFHKIATNSFKMKMFMLSNLPMAFLAGLKIISINHKEAKVSVPYKYLNKNPFKSMYFAVQAMAAELSSGIMAMSIVKSASVPVSMLVLGMSASYTKKARTKVVFTCSNGIDIKNAVDKSIETGEGQIVKVTSVGKDLEGDIVAEFNFTWTFKPKK